MISDGTMSPRLILRMPNDIIIALYSDDDITHFFIKRDREIRKEKLKKLKQK